MRHQSSGPDPNPSQVGSCRAPGTARRNSPSASVSPQPSGGPTPRHDGRSPALHLRVQTPGKEGDDGVKVPHTCFISFLSLSVGHRLKRREETAGNSGLLPFFFFWQCGAARRILVPRPGSNLCPLQWKLRVLTTGPPGKSPFYLFEDHDISTFIIFPKGEGCQASHFHHIVSGKGERRGKAM